MRILRLKYSNSFFLSGSQEGKWFGPPFLAQDEDLGAKIFKSFALSETQEGKWFGPPLLVQDLDFGADIFKVFSPCPNHKKESDSNLPFSPRWGILGLIFSKCFQVITLAYIQDATFSQDVIYNQTTFILGRSITRPRQQKLILTVQASTGWVLPFIVLLG